MTIPKPCRTSRAPDITTRLLYGRREAAQLLSISVRSLDYMVADGRLRCRRIGGRVLLTPQELARFVDSLPVTEPHEMNPAA